MEMIVMHEVSGAEDVKALEGCTISAVCEEDSDGEGIRLECISREGNCVYLSLLENGSWFFHNSQDFPKKKLSVEQYGKIAKLVDDLAVDSVDFNTVSDSVEIVIKVFCKDEVDRILADVKGVLPSLVVSECRWILDGRPYPMYRCFDEDYFLDITIVHMGVDPIDRDIREVKSAYPS